jgi:hypothetical protein
MDEVPIPLQPLLKSNDPSDEEVLNAIAASLSAASDSSAVNYAGLS